MTDWNAFRFNSALISRVINSVEDIDYNDDGTITLRVPIDDITHQKYLKEFENERFEGNKRQTGRIAPPPGWNAKG
jgi:hypothetical protein